jgi:hypothetical protein
MIQTKQSPQERATAIAERDQLHPFPCTRRDTGEVIWLVQSRSDPSRHYLLKVSEETIQCPCPRAHHHGTCAHAAAVRLALQAEPQQSTMSASPPKIQPPAPQAPHQDPRSACQREQERQWRVEAEHREHALLWTDNRPFSIWK